MTLKSLETEQFARTAADGDEANPPSQEAAPGDNQGKSLLVDRYGRPFVRVVGGGLSGSVVSIPGEVNTGNSVTRFSDQLGLNVAWQVTLGPTKVYFVLASNEAAAARYLQLFDKAGAPILGEVPTYSVRIPQSGDHDVAEIDLMPLGDYFSNGVGAGISTTFLTFTPAPNPQNHNLTCLYKV